MNLSGIIIAALLLAAPPQDGPVVRHPKVNEGALVTDSITVTFVSRKQHYNSRDTLTYDRDITSPKSVSVHPDGRTCYVNSLEGGSTVSFDVETGEKISVISHKIDSSHIDLWAPDSGLFPFTYDYEHPDFFTGKPVESAFSHGGAYLWVPYYRRSFDLNAQDPSAVAVIDTQSDVIVRLFETGPLPKMVASSDDGKWVAVTHWGNNTVGLIDVSSDNPAQWRYWDCFTVDYKLRLNFSRSVPVNRDEGSGYCLRGTLFTPDGRYLMVGCMGGSGGIAVIDLEQSRYLGRVMGAMPNVRHILCSGGYLYLSVNNRGYVQRAPMDSIYAAAARLEEGRSTAVAGGWESCKVLSGARTIVASPDGEFIFVACNRDSRIAVVSTRTMTMVGSVAADSFPVGLDISEDGRTLISTSQGRVGVGGGNAVDIFRIEYTYEKKDIDSGGAFDTAPVQVMGTD